jgi:hypothetical protein
MASITITSRSRIPFARFLSLAGMRVASRWLIHAFLIVSLLLFAATILLWIRGYKWIAGAGWRSVDWSATKLVIFDCGISSDRGGFLIAFGRNEAVGKHDVNLLFNNLAPISPGFHAFVEDGPPAVITILGPSYSSLLTGSNIWGFQTYFLQRRRTTFHAAWWDREILMPHWFPAIVFLLPSASFLPGYIKRRRRKLRIRHGLCINCGYDLRASPNQCPECGTESTKVTETQRNPI